MRKKSQASRRNNTPRKDGRGDQPLKNLQGLRNIPKNTYLREMRGRRETEKKKKAGGHYEE